MKLRNVTFDAWLRSHPGKEAEERWLRELYPWPVLANVDVSAEGKDRPQLITHDGVEYEALLISSIWQPDRGTFRHRIRISSAGLGWHSRSFDDEYDMCGSKDGDFVTLFHAKKKEPLERIARAFFTRRWADIEADAYRTLAVSRFLGASIVTRVAGEAYAEYTLSHYPQSRLTSGVAPVLADADRLWVGHRFYSEDAYEWARRAGAAAERVVSVYFADTTYQIRTDLPTNAEVVSVSALDARALNGHYEDMIMVLIRRLELPTGLPGATDIESIVRGRRAAPHATIAEADVQEALAAMSLRCESKDDLRYQLACAVLINAWIESERRLGFSKRKKFYAFKATVGDLVRWALKHEPDGVACWADETGAAATPVVYVRIDGVDFSFHAIPGASDLVVRSSSAGLEWSGMRLKPIAPLVLAWARDLRRGAR